MDDVVDLEALGLTQEQWDAILDEYASINPFAVANTTAIGDEVEDGGFVGVPCTGTLEEFSDWHTNTAGLPTENINTDYELYVAVCQAQSDPTWIPSGGNMRVVETDNNKLLKTGLLVGGAFLVYKSIFKK
jgi:hypothetical protein